MSGETWVRLTSLGVILAEGPEARSFLQGQLTADLDRLGPTNMLLAAVNSPQGRVQAVVRLVQRPDAIAMILPSSMVDSTVARLRKYTLRAKVTLHSGNERLVAHAVLRSAIPVSAGLAAPIDHGLHDGVSYLSWIPASDHVVALAPPNIASHGDPAFEAAWRLTEIRAGLPQVYAQTHEAFVAQMLNLDLIDGISFDKGCYTGQEIIARTHFRGAIKRRMFLFAASSAPPAPGTRILHADQHAGEVVDAASSGEGCELLAVVSLAQRDQQLTVEGTGAQLQRLAMSYDMKM